MSKKTKWIFGYQGHSHYHWLMACSLRDLLKQLDNKGMTPPEWYEDTGHGA